MSVRKEKKRKVGRAQQGYMVAVDTTDSVHNTTRKMFSTRRDIIKKKHTAL